MNTLEYPYHPEAWQRNAGLGEVALKEMRVLGTDEGTFVFNIWRNGYFGCAYRLERPFVYQGKDTEYTLSLEDHASGKRYFGRQSFIEAEERRPPSNPKSRRDYGILKFSEARGLLEEPKGTIPKLQFKRFGVPLMTTDPAEMVLGFEELVAESLRLAPSGWEPPLR